MGEILHLSVLFPFTEWLVNSWLKKPLFHQFSPYLPSNDFFLPCTSNSLNTGQFTIYLGPPFPFHCTVSAPFQDFYKQKHYCANILWSLLRVQ